MVLTLSTGLSSASQSSGRFEVVNGVEAAILDDAATDGVVQLGGGILLELKRGLELRWYAMQSWLIAPS